jgi:hypothetical protein
MAPNTTNAPVPHYHTFDWRVLGLALGSFFAITFALCVAFDLVFPGQAMYHAWLKLFPGFMWLTWWSFLLGLVESVAYGLYVALVFCPLYNTFASRFARSRERSRRG